MKKSVDSRSILLTTLLAVFLAGCSATKPRSSFAGSGAIFAAQQFSGLNLCNTLIQFELASIQTRDAAKEENIGALRVIQPTKAPPVNTCIINSSETLSKINRNNFVTYVMGISDQKCGVYKIDVLRGKASRGTTLNSLSTLFAMTSSVLEHQLTAQAFAAAAGGASGVNAVFDQERFANLTLEVITAGIEQRRQTLADQVVSKFDRSILEYPVGLAVKDAMQYHAACNAVTGLEVAKNAINRVDNPGIKEAMKVVTLVNETVNPTPPAARDEAFKFVTAEDTPLSDISSGVDVTTNQIKSVTAVSGSVSVSSAGLLSYMPKQHFNGLDTISFAVEDTAGNSTPKTLRIWVTPVNDRPVAKDDAPITVAASGQKASIDVLSNDTDVENSELKVISATAQKGQVVINKDNTLTYTAPSAKGSDVIVYRIAEVEGDGSVSASAKIPVTVN